MKEKHICFFNSAKAWGGGEKWHFEVACRLHQEGFQVTVITNPGSALHEKLKKTTIPVIGIRVTNLSFLNFIKVKKVSALFKKLQVTSLIINLSGDLKLSGIAGKRAGIPQIIYRRGSAIPIKNTWLNRYLFGKIITGIIANSEETKKTILTNLNIVDEKKIRVIYNGIDLSTFDKQKTNKTFTRDKKIIIGNLGRMVKQKGQHYLIDIAVKLKQKYDDFKIIIGGTGPLEDEIKNLARKKHVRQYILFAGFIEDVKGFMESVDIFILPSLWEGFGYVLVEAMACNKPVVAFKVSSNPEIIGDEGGYTCTLGNIEEMTTILYRLIMDKNIRQRSGELGRKRVEREFQIEKTIDKVKQVLSDPELT